MTKEKMKEVRPALTVKDISNRLGCPSITIWGWVRRGVIPHYKIETAIRFDPDEIDAWIESKRGIKKEG